MDNKIIIGQRLREFRESLETSTVSALASATGVKDAHIVDAERGKVLASKQLVDALKHHFDLREEWLSCGIGTMQIGNDELEYRKKLANLAEASVVIARHAELSDAEKNQIRDIMYGLKANDISMVRQALKHNEREAKLLENYRAASEDGKRAIETTSAALAQPIKKPKMKM